MIELEHHQLVLRYRALRVRDRTREARLAASLSAEGQRCPVLVVPTGDKFVLIDGYARVAALAHLGRDTVLAVALDLDETQALVLHHRLENARERTALEEGWLVLELVGKHGLSQEEAGEALQRSGSWISRRLALVRVLPERVQEKVRQGALGAHGAARYLVPLARANPGACTTLVENLSRRVSTRELGEIYRAFARGDALTQERIAAQPMLLLVAMDEELPETASESSGADDAGLVGDLRMVAGISRRALHRAERLAPDIWSEPLRRAGLEFEIASRNLLDELKRRCTRAGSG